MAVDRALRREYVEGEALQAGFEGRRLAAAVDIVMSATEDGMDDDTFEQCVADMLQDMPTWEDFSGP